MKRMKIFLTMAFASIFLLGTAVYAGDDVRINYSQLPADAQKFITTYFGANPATKEVEHELTTGEYSVELRNGYDMTFDSTGKLIEIDSPDRKAILVKIVKAVLPAKAVDYLQKQNLINNVDDIKVLRNGGFVVDIDKWNHDKEYRFDAEGNFVR